MKTIRLLPFLLLINAIAPGQQNPIQIDANGLTQTFGAGGIVTRGQIVKINSSGQVVPVLTTDTSGAIGIAATSQQNVGQSVTVSIAGTPLVQIDASGCAAGNIISFSTTTGGAGHCAATASGQQVGIAVSISSPGSNFWNVALSLGGGGAGGVPGQFSVKTYGAVGDAKSTNDCVATNLSSTWTSASNPWTAADVGKLAYNSQGYGNPPFAVTKITGFNSAGSITVAAQAAGTGTGMCVWFTQKETTAFTGALAAAKAALASRDPHYGGSPTLAYAAQVYCPPGGYVLDGPWFNQNYASANTNGVSFQGSGKGSCNIYISPDFVAGASAVFGFTQQAVNFFMDGFTINGSGSSGGMNFSLGNTPGFNFSNVFNLRLSNFTITDYNNTQDTLGVVLTQAGQGVTLENLFIVSSGQGPGYNCSSTGAVMGLNNIISNGGATNLNINCGTRGPNSQPFLWKGALVDECSGASSACTVVQSGAVADFDSVGLFGESASFGALNCLGTCYLNSVDVGSFSSANNQPAIAESSTGYVYATGSWIRGNGTSPMVTGTSAATFIDAGGNKWLNCSGVTCNPITAAQYATLAFTGGIIPKAAVTHTPNTCYAVTGNLLATAQNICTLLLDQNYQVLNITAQSGGTTPTNSSCTGAPVITLSDGTRTATLTMTTGKAAWSSAVDASTVNTVMASGATLTVSIGANTCATPPSNVSVNYVLQSVLNP